MITTTPDVQYKVLIGMEIHVQLATKSKMFTGAANGTTPSRSFPRPAQFHRRSRAPAWIVVSTLARVPLCAVAARVKPRRPAAASDAMSRATFAGLDAAHRTLGYPVARKPSRPLLPGPAADNILVIAMADRIAVGGCAPRGDDEQLTHWRV